MGTRTVHTAPPAWRRVGAALTLGAIAVASALGAQAPGEGAGPATEEPVLARSFAIPDTRYARALVDSAEGHIAAERWAEAIADLQELILEHRGEVLGATEQEARGKRSRQPVHAGAAETAHALLLGLPAAGRTLYADRYGLDAQRAFEAARSDGDRRALIRVARRYPLTEAAMHAWWTIGDLELELGNPESARAAWERARELALRLELTLPAGAEARLAFRAPGLAPGALATGDVIEPAGSDEAADAAWAGSPGLPGRDCDSWSQRIDEDSRGVPFNAVRGEHYNLYPHLAGDTLLVSNSMRLHAFDAWSGEQRWRSDEAPGWDRVDRKLIHAQNAKGLTRADFFQAIDYDSVLIAPAASGGIAIAALQIPVTQLGNTRYQNIPITRVIPDRRLFAFDLRSGRPLWNHMPPPLWDGESGSFEQRMRIAAPPVIAGSRILVPTYRIQGRITYHLACFDLFSGALQWSTSLISGQMPLNMFGRHQKEFAAAPVRIEGDRVIALTQLGAIAAVDLYSGDILWETLYEQIPLPPTVHWTAPRRERSWTNTAPIVTDGVVVATPLDSNEMIGLDLESGTMFWSLPKNRLPAQKYSKEELTLIGASDDTVWLSGSNVTACRAPRGLASRSGPIECTRGEPLFEDRDDFPRPALSARHIVVPTDHRRVVLKRDDIRFEDSHNSSEWGPDAYAGNLLLKDGALFALSSKYITACLDWSLLEQRRLAALRANPQSDQLALAYANLLERRGASELERGSLSTSLSLLATARETLEPRLEGERSPADGGLATELRAGLHRVLRGEARAFELQANSPAAIARLERARELAPNRYMLRDTLLLLAELQRRSSNERTWFEVLDELETSCGDLPWSPPGGGTPRDIALWVHTQRADAHAAAGRTSDELVELHAILERWGDVPLPAADAVPGPDPAARTTAAERISVCIERDGRGVYAPFEARARELLDQALEEDNLEDLERLDRLFPHSAAARTASDARLEAALERSDTASAVQIVQRAIPDEFQLARSSEQEARLLLDLAHALETRGNSEFAAAVRARLAAHHPALIPAPRPGLDQARGADTKAGASLRELVAAVPAPGPAKHLSESSSFDDSALTQHALPGAFIRLGSLPLSTQGTRGPQGVQVLARVDASPHTVHAFSHESRGESLWVHELSGERILHSEGSPSHLTAERVIVAGRSELTGLDAATGEQRWRWRTSGERVLSVTGASGVTLVTCESDSGLELVALDSQAGIPLWRRPVPRGFWGTPVCGDGSAVLLPQKTVARGRARVLDLFTGGSGLELELGSRVIEGDVEGAWIEGGALILPRFPMSQGTGDCVVAFDLEDGHRLWHVADDPEREFDSIARNGREVYLIFTAGSLPGLVQQLDTRLGAVRRIQGVSLERSDVPIGIRRHRVTQLEGPYMFLRSEDAGSRGTRLRAIQLPFGERWSYRLSIDPNEIYNAMPLPTLSRATVAFAYTEPRRSRGSKPQTSLLLVNRNNGTPQDARLLAPALGNADDLEFVMFDSALAILGRDQLLFLAP